MTDTLSLLAMVVVMFVPRWDFARIALAVAPLLAAFVLRVNKAVRTAVTEVRTRQSDPLATLQEGLQSIEVVKAHPRGPSGTAVQKTACRRRQRGCRRARDPRTNTIAQVGRSIHNYIAYNSAMHIANQFTYTSKPALTRRRFRSTPNGHIFGHGPWVEQPRVSHFAVAGIAAVNEHAGSRPNQWARRARPSDGNSP